MRNFHQDAVIDEFEALTKDVGKVQRETLKMILEENSEAEYLQNLGLGGRTDPESFKACVPLVSHADLDSYIRRIVAGDSGTTQGKPKYVPFNDLLVQNAMQVYRTSFAFRNKVFPHGDGKALKFIYGSHEVRTSGGIVAASVSANIFRSDQFKRTMKDIQSQATSPDEVTFGRSFEQSLYCHLLCGLLSYQEVQFIYATFVHNIVQAFRTFELVWEELCANIRDGVLSPKITDPSMRAAVSKLLTPNPQLADEIYNKCKGLNNWLGLIPELWPNTKYVHGIMTGSMEPYLKKLRHYAGDLPLLSFNYGSSEGVIGVNIHPELRPEEVRFAVVPDIGGDKPAVEAEPIGLEEIEVGKEYEIIITNFAGLYRYRLGDVVRLQFVCRRSLVLNVNIDKNTERDLQLAVDEASKLVATENLEVIDFSRCVDRSAEPGHYVIFWELSGEAREGVLHSCADCLDRSFVDAGYMTSRKAKGIAPLELRIVRQGTFRKVLEHYINHGASIGQFKNPRFIGASNAAVLRILCDNVVESFFSTAYD
ncbi:unnamed protein product [Spirodela intermedia]|uniref:Uncharacterized protein n=1 Tax=Spirodela intermedia TaxID=51605 RepID=A0A7I8J6Z8_SPIIN|nr:unnamed protein product [Spirodela intermedia]CAA6665891.1 unnamed protein product [Spirodela intermedia]